MFVGSYFFHLYYHGLPHFFNYSTILVLKKIKSQHISSSSIVIDCNVSYFPATIDFPALIDSLMTFLIVAIILPVKYYTDFQNSVSVYESYMNL